MKKLFVFLFYLAALVAIVMVADMWRGASQSGRQAITEEVRVMRHELRDVRDEMDKLSGMVVQQQATLAKVEDTLKAGGSAVETAVAAQEETMVKAGHQAVADLIAAVANKNSEKIEPEPAVAAPAVVEPAVAAPAIVEPALAAPTVVEPALAPAELDDPGRKTVSFGKTSTGIYVRTVSEEPVVEVKSELGGSMSTGFPDLALLVSTSTLHGATNEGMAGTAATGGAVAAAIAEAERALAAAAGTTVVADVKTEITNAMATVLKRVTTVAATTGTPESVVAAPRSSRLGREVKQQAEAAGPLSISDQLVSEGGRKRKATISDIMKQYLEQEAAGTNKPAGGTR